MHTLHECEKCKSTFITENGCRHHEMHCEGRIEFMGKPLDYWLDLERKSQGLDSERWVPVEEGLPEDENMLIDLVGIMTLKSEPPVRKRLTDMRWCYAKVFPDSVVFTHYRKITLPKTGEPK
ncbi:hypothetical protein KAR91_50895 [Candidatus Pacearchaeota archaeon]|nr:hypothetical protein [Candidatus Pacearchaeota archaeon]